MNFTILTPGEGNLASNKSDMVDGRFGGRREHSNTANAKDYTARTMTNVDKKENPVDETLRDVDDMSNTEEKKNEFTYQEKKMNVQAGNESVAIQSDSDKRPRMDEGSSAVQVPEVVEERVRKKANPWQYSSSDTYEGETR